MRGKGCLMVFGCLVLGAVLTIVVICMVIGLVITVVVYHQWNTFPDQRIENVVQVRIEDTGRYTVVVQSSPDTLRILFVEQGRCDTCTLVFIKDVRAGQHNWVLLAERSLSKDDKIIPHRIEVHVPAAFDMPNIPDRSRRNLPDLPRQSLAMLAPA